mgnify:FL=1
MAINKSLQVISKSLNLRKEMIFVHSSETSQGKESILEFIENAIEK